LTRFASPRCRRNEAPEGAQARHDSGPRPVSRAPAARFGDPRRPDRTSRSLGSAGTRWAGSDGATSAASAWRRLGGIAGTRRRDPLDRSGRDYVHRARHPLERRRADPLEDVGGLCSTMDGPGAAAVQSTTRDARHASRFYTTARHLNVIVTYRSPPTSVDLAPALVAIGIRAGRSSAEQPMGVVNAPRIRGATRSGHARRRSVYTDFAPSDSSTRRAAAPSSARRTWNPTEARAYSRGPTGWARRRAGVTISPFSTPASTRRIPTCSTEPKVSWKSAGQRGLRNRGRGFALRSVRSRGIQDTDSCWLCFCFGSFLGLP